jgi:hypothetical protein
MTIRLQCIAPPPEFGILIVALFAELAGPIDSRTTTDQHSDTVMALLRPGRELGGTPPNQSRDRKGALASRTF